MATSLLGHAGQLASGKPAVQAGPDDVDVYLAGVAARLSSAGVATPVVRLNRPAADAILTVARRRHAALIAMATHGRGGLSRLVFGSIAQAVLRGAPCPLLLVPAAAKAQPVAGGGVGADDTSRSAAAAGFHLRFIGPADAEPTDGRGRRP
jgi:hypothetical protein